MPPELIGQLPGAVLFACNFNQVRSPMAEALTKLMYGNRVYVDSCGLKPEEGVDPFVTIVIDEVGADISRHRTKSFDDLVDTSFDLVISLTPHAQHRAVELARGRAIEIEPSWIPLSPRARARRCWTPIAPRATICADGFWNASAGHRRSVVE